MTANRKLPPEGRRFQKGQSGNPNGRPRKSDRLMSLLKQVDPVTGMVLKNFSKKVSRRTSKGKIESITRDEAVVDRLFQLAMAGNVRALIHCDSISKAAHDARAKIALDIFAQALQHRDRYLPAFLEAEKNGSPVPNILPDPRDIEFHPDGSVTIDGPMTIADKMNNEELAKIRDIAVEFLDNLPDHLTTRQRNRAIREVGARRDEIDALLPKRMRLDRH